MAAPIFHALIPRSGRTLASQALAPESESCDVMRCLLNRRRALFHQMLLSLLFISPAFFAIALLQESAWRAQIVLVSASIHLVALLGAAWLNRRGHFSVALSTLCALESLVLLLGPLTVLAYDPHTAHLPPAAWLLSGVLVLAFFHLDARHIMFVATTTFVSTLILWAAFDLQNRGVLPMLLLLQIVIALLAYFHNQVVQRTLLKLLDDWHTLARNKAELELAHQQADEAAGRAQAADKAKSLFLSMMSHELRTPLNIMLGHAELVKESIAFDELEPDEALEDLTRVADAGQSLLGMIEGVLSLASLDVEREQLTLSHFRVHELMETLLAVVGPSAERASLALRVEQEVEGGMELFQDRGKLEQILLNLLTNAIKFTPAGEVTLRVSCHGSQLCFAIADTGVGIAPEDQERIFEPFVQAKEGFTREVDGAGIGLALCRRFADRLGAQLALESRVGVGTTFSLVVARAHDEARATR